MGRGVTGGFDGQVRVTVSNIWLDLISLKVNAETAITQQGRALGVQDLAVGQQIALASYDPADPVWFFNTGGQEPPANFAGRVGAFPAEIPTGPEGASRRVGRTEGQAQE